MDRKIFFDNIITVPATKTAGAATYSSAVLSDFVDNAFGGAKIIFGADDTTQITDTFTVVPQVSFDGTSFFKAASYTDLVANAGSATVNEEWTLTITGTAGVATTGTINITLPGLSVVNVDVADGDTNIVVGGNIEGESFGDWIVTDNGDGTVTFEYPGAIAGTPVVSYTGVTVQTASFAIVTEGADANYDVGFVKTVALAPYLKVSLVGDGTSALAEGHGVNVDVLKYEVDQAYRRNVIVDACPITTIASGNILTSEVIDLGDNASCYKVFVSACVGDASKITDDVTFDVETSVDGDNWTSVASGLTGLANGTGSSCTTTSYTDDLGKYFRVKVDTTAGGSIAADAGIQINLVFLY